MSIFHSLKSISKPYLIAAGLVGAVALAVGVYFFQKASARQSIVPVDPAFSAYIEGYTSGVISSESSIKVKLMEDLTDSVKIVKALEEGIFSFSPSLSGTTRQIDKRTFEFKPTEKLPNNTVYTVSFALGELVEMSETNLKTFEFGFRVIPQFYEVTYEGLHSTSNTDLQSYHLKGTVSTADVAEDAQVEKLVHPEYSTPGIKVIWQHQPDHRTHHFTLTGIRRNQQESTLELEWNGSPLDVDSKETKTIAIPAVGEFKFLETLVQQSPDQYVKFIFSDPLKENQVLEGLITIGNLTSLRYQLVSNEVRVYPPLRQTGSFTAQIASGVRNIQDKKLPDDVQQTVVFEELKPAVRSLVSGTVLPGSDGITLPFEAVNLKAVEVKIIKIYENNVLQFLQSNNLSGTNELKRVGRPAIRKIIPLNTAGVADLGKWNRFSLDLASLIQTEPGAIYQVSIGFRKNMAVYACGASGEEENLQLLTDESQSWEESFDNPESYYDYESNYDDDYDWEQRDNPCHSSYYASDRSVKMNVLASDLGMLAKRGNDGSIFICITSLLTTKPLSNTDVEVFDFQNQLLGATKTDSEGWASLALGNRRPFLLIAKSGKQRGYLKLDEGSSLSVSNFDVSGTAVQKGLKGFIYGERGVWRPGDSLFLTFMLEDKQKSLPKIHPVIFELVNPQGKLEKRMVRSSSVNGIYSFTTTTDQNAPTGTWQAQVKVGGSVFSKSIKIETIKPNRLKINLDFGTKKLVAGQEIKGRLNAKWLHGAPAAGLRAKFEVTLAQGITKFDAFPLHVFDDPTVSFSPETQTIFEEGLDAEGNAIVPVDLQVENKSPGALNAIFKGKVFEKGGDFSIHNFTLPYYPYASFVGMFVKGADEGSGMLDTDKDHAVEIVAVDGEGKPIDRQGIKMEMYKLSWRWWWEQNGSGNSNFLNEEYAEPIQQGVVSTQNGKAVWNVRVNYPEWGRYYVRATDPVSGHSTGKIMYIDWSSYAGRDKKDIPGGATMLSFNSDKQKYQTGENIKLHFPGSKNGRALVSIENGTGILEKYWVETQEGENTFSFKASSSMAPTVYAHITLIQPHNQTANDLPIRLYGIKAISVDDPATHLQPIIQMPDVLKPEQTVSIRVSEKEGKAMAYTVAVVDEGLLDLTRFETPDPWPVFYAREALGVKTWDIYDQVIGAYRTDMARLLSIGGDEISLPKENKQAMRFKPVVKFLGPFYISKGESKNHTFKMPNYLGSVRTMVVAGYEGSYGSTEKTVAVKQPLMVLATLPRVVGPDEEVKLPVTIFASDASVKDVRIQVKTNTLLQVTGAASQTVRFVKPGEMIVPFTLKIANALGVGTVQVIAQSGSQQSVYEVELNVRNPNSTQTSVQEYVIEPGQSWNTTFDQVGISGTNKAYLEFSSIPPINLTSRLSYLLQYPHGCVEQTTSAAFPQLYVHQIMQISETDKQKAGRNIKAAINRLSSFQQSNGGFSYWPGSGSADDWGSSYAGHFLIEAEAQGYALSEGMLARWKSFQQKQASEWREPKGEQKLYNNDLLQAYRLYTLCLGKNPDLASMNRLKESKNLTVQAAWRLAAAYSLAGQTPVAKEMIQNLPVQKEQSYNLYSYGSPDRDLALTLETLTMLSEKTKAATVAKEISNALNTTNYWMSTQTTAYCLLAMCRYTISQQGDGKISVSYALNGGKTTNATTALPLVQTPIPVKGTTPGSVSIKNNNNGVLFAKLITQGIPAMGNEVAAENNLSVEVIYKTTNGRIIDPVTIPQGTDFYAEVTVTNPGLKGNYTNIALTQILPGGWEILNQRMDGTQSLYSQNYTYQDVRDDRVMTYFDLRANERKVFNINLNATYGGYFYLPGISCEAMYDASVYARQKGKWIKIESGRIN